MIKGIKICGISDLITLQYILNHPYKPTFLGFITNYPASKRYVPHENLKKLINVDKKGVKFCSVLVNPDEDVLEKIRDLPFDYYQIYDVSAERTKYIKQKYNKKIISALTIKNKKDIDKYKLFENIADIILFDGPGYSNSVAFDHDLIKNLPNKIVKMVAGNIKIEDIPNFQIESFIDLSKAVEISEGIKDLNKIDKLLNIVNSNIKNK